jgi:hypothetical protein
LTNSGYFGDKPGLFQDKFATTDEIEKVEPVKIRWELTSSSQWVDLSGPIHVPFFDSENLLLNNMNVDIELVRTTPEFLMYDETANVKYRIEIQNPCLTIRRYKPAPSLLSSISKNVDKVKVKYSFRNVDMKATNFSAGLSRISIPNITTGQIPSRIIFAFLNAKNFGGAYNKNPYYFQPFDLNDINLYVNSEKYPSIPITYNFTAGIVGKGYEFFLEQLGIHHSKTNGISKDGYTSGYTFFVYDLTSDLSASEDHFSMIQTGDVFAEFNFSAPLPNEVTCVVYAEYEKLVEVDAFRNIKTDEQIF